MPKKKKTKSRAARSAQAPVEDAINKPDPNLEPPAYHHVKESYDPRTGFGKETTPPDSP